MSLLFAVAAVVLCVDQNTSFKGFLQTGIQYQSLEQALQNSTSRGFHPTYVDFYSFGAVTLVNLILEPVPKHRVANILLHGMNQQETFHALYDEPLGRLPAFVESFRLKGEIKYAVIMTAKRDADVREWRVILSTPPKAWSVATAKLIKLGYHPVSVTVQSEDRELLRTALWYMTGDDSSEWQMDNQVPLDSFSPSPSCGPVHVDAYSHNSKIFLSVICRKNTPLDMLLQVANRKSASQLTSLMNINNQPITIAGYTIGHSKRYTATWFV